VGATPCRFDSDLRHHDFRHEQAPWLCTKGLFFGSQLATVDQTLTKCRPKGLGYVDFTYRFSMFSTAMANSFCMLGKTWE
jgi:hypothetical protein